MGKLKSVTDQDINVPGWLRVTIIKTDGHHVWFRVPFREGGGYQQFCVDHRFVFTEAGAAA